MAKEYPLPKWGLTMEEGTIAEWLVSPGDTVTEGQVLATVSTDKIEVDLESPAGGVVAALLVPAGETAAVGTSVIVIADDADDCAAWAASNS